MFLMKCFERAYSKKNTIVKYTRCFAGGTVKPWIPSKPLAIARQPAVKKRGYKLGCTGLLGILYSQGGEMGAPYTSV